MSDECADFIERIVYLLDNELEEAECTEVRVHIESCSPCLERYDVQRTIKALVARSCAERAPDSLRAKVLVSLREVHVRYES
jgi:mycothiol system anti-sigma-R factor